MDLRFSIRNRLIALAGAGVVAVVAVGGIAFVALRDLAGHATDIAVHGEGLRNHMDGDMMHDGLRGDVMAALLARTPEEAEQARQDVREHAERFRADLAANEKLPLGTAIQDGLAHAKPALEAYIDKALAIVGLASTDHDAAMAELDAFGESFRALENEMEGLGDAITRANEATLGEARSGERVAKSMIVAIVLIAMVALTLASLPLIRSIIQPIRRFEHAMDDLAQGEGDLTRRMDGHERHEIGHMALAFNRFMDKLHDVIAQTRVSMDAVAQASGEMHASTDSISNSAQTQAASIEETAASLEEITATIRQNADNARLASNLAANARQVAEQGGAVVTQAVSAMAEINESSRRIGVIIGTIDEIAFQTNLLALNAAVEAARAGEQGRGFAVVASEVRNLAQRAAGAAREIKALIADSLDKVGSGATLVNRSGESLHEILDAVKKVTDVVSEIAAASQEQALGVDEVNRAVTQMDQVTQANAAQTEELSATASQLSDQARTVHALIGRFKLANAEARMPGPPSLAVPGARAAARSMPARTLEPELASSDF